MKRISMKLQSGFSRNDRITFSNEKFSVTAILKPNGKIEYEKKDSEKLSLLSIFYIIIGFFELYLPHFLKSTLIIPNLSSNKKLIILYLLPSFIYFLLTLLSVLCTHSDKKLIKNHGAEHKVFNAYKHLKRIPSIEEAKKFSRIIFYCSSNLYPALFLCQIIGYIVYMYKGYIIPEILLFIVPYIKPGLFTLGYLVQYFTTQEPDDDSIMLAIAAITELDRITNM